MSTAHGTASGWRNGCRCDRCHRALLSAARVWWATRVLKRGGEPASRVPPGRMLTHLDRLADAGMNARQVAHRAGVAEATLSRARRPGVKVSRIVESAVLSVPAP